MGVTTLGVVVCALAAPQATVADTARIIATALIAGLVEVCPSDT
jgi:hypothetical protein